MKATWKGKVIAESDDIVYVEGNAYFPIDSLNRDLLQDSDTTTRCWWKGEAHYWDVVVDGEKNADAAWYYPEPSDAAVGKVKDRVAFWRGVEVS